MARKNPKIVQLETALAEAKAIAKNEHEMRNFKEGKLEAAEERLAKLESENRQKFSFIQDQHRELENQLQWMRNLVEKITIPTDKIVALQKAKVDLITSGSFPLDQRALMEMLEK